MGVSGPSLLIESTDSMINFVCVQINNTSVVNMITMLDDSGAAQKVGLVGL